MTYTTIDLKNIKLFKRGKVRDIFDLGDKLLMVATDRVSAFDVVLPDAIPHKGKILNLISAYWFKKLDNISPNHFITANVNEFPVELSSAEKTMLSQRSSLVEKGKTIEVECVVRGYLAGSGWQTYKETGKLLDITLPGDLKQGSKLPEPLFTPATKSQDGHDINITFAQVKNEVGTWLAQYLKEKSIKLYRIARDYLYEKGLILVDTKFEFAVIDDKIKLVDELLTPDSSRLWDKTGYKPGRPQLNFDKQYIRDYLISQNWDKAPPAPRLPQHIIKKSTEKYLEAYKKTIGVDYADTDYWKWR